MAYDLARALQPVNIAEAFQKGRALQQEYEHNKILDAQLPEKLAIERQNANTNARNATTNEGNLSARFSELASSLDTKRAEALKEAYRVGYEAEQNGEDPDEAMHEFMRTFQDADEEAINQLSYNHAVGKALFGEDEKPLSTPGKIVSDREAVVSEFGEGSAEVRRFDEYAAKSGNNVTVNVGEKKGNEALAKALGDNLATTAFDTGAATSTARLADAFLTIQDDAYGGRLAPIQAELSAWAQSLGVESMLDRFDLSNKASSTELMRSLINQMTLQRRTGVRDPQLNKQENQLLADAGARLSGTPAGNRVIAEMLKKTSEHDLEMSAYAAELSSRVLSDEGYNVADAQKDLIRWQRENPAFTQEDYAKYRAIMNKADQPAANLGDAGEDGWHTTEVNGRKVRVRKLGGKK